jgi:hypothetical protein
MVVQLKYIVGSLYDAGHDWIKNIGANDWRRERYFGNRTRRSGIRGPSNLALAENAHSVQGYIGKTASSATASSQIFFVMAPDSACEDDNAIVLLRPVLKTNFDNEVTLNFHLWFHSIYAGDEADHLMVGWRLEAPEGGEPKKATHDFFHAQPLTRYGADGTTHGVHRRSSERFPTIPLPAANIIELCLTTVLMASGKEGLRGLVTKSTNPEVRAAARAYWTKMFGSQSP